MPETKTRKTRPARAPKASKAKMIIIEQHRSPIGCNVGHKRVLRALGLRRIRQRVERPDNPAVRGMVATIPHVVRIVEV